MTIVKLHRSVLLALLALAVVWGWWWLSRGAVVTAWVGAVLILLIHAPVLALEFVLMHRINRDDAAPRACWGEVVSAWWAECRLGVLMFGWAMPFRSRRFDDHVPANAAGRRGVVLVHGFLCNRGVWNGWMSKLLLRDVPFIAVNLETPFASIDSYAPTIDAAVERLTRATGLAPVVVAHSMGGLAMRAWLRHRAAIDGWQEGQELHHVFTLGTPHRGTAITMLQATTNVREMRSNSVWVGALATQEAATLRARFTCYYSHCDNIVFPASTATLPGADNRHVRATAHMQLIEVDAIFEAVLKRLTDVEPTEPMAPRRPAAAPWAPTAMGRDAPAASGY